MRKNKRLLITIIATCLIIMTIFLGLWINKSNRSEELIYSTTYSFTLGSRRVQIYGSGEVYDDLEVKNPDHEVDYKYVKTLTAEQMESLKAKKAQNPGEEELSNFVIELVHGVKEFNDFGEY